MAQREFGWRQTISNVVRNSAEQFSGRSEQWNQWLYNSAVALDHAIGADLNDPATTWPGARFEPPRNANHEANTANRWHLLILAVCIAWLIWRREGRMLLYCGGLIAGFLLFCFYLKWQPFMARMFLPLFVLASPIAGVVIERIGPRGLDGGASRGANDPGVKSRSRGALSIAREPGDRRKGAIRSVLPILLCLFLVNNARPYLFENWVRPLKGPHSLLRTTRDPNYSPT